MVQRARTTGQRQRTPASPHIPQGHGDPGPAPSGPGAQAGHRGLQGRLPGGAQEEESEQIEHNEHELRGGRPVNDECNDYCNFD